MMPWLNVNLVSAVTNAVDHLNHLKRLEILIEAALDRLDHSDRDSEISIFLSCYISSSELDLNELEISLSKITQALLEFKRQLKQLEQDTPN